MDNIKELNDIIEGSAKLAKLSAFNINSNTRYYKDLSKQEIDDFLNGLVNNIGMFESNFVEIKKL